MKEDENPQREQNEPLQVVSLPMDFLTVSGHFSWFWNEPSELKQSWWVFLSGNWNVRFSADLCWPPSQMWFSPWHFKALMKSRDDLDSCSVFHGTLMANSAPWPQPSRWPKCSLGSISTPFIAWGQNLSWRHSSRHYNHFPQLEICFSKCNIVYAGLVPQDKFCPHCSPESSPGPRPDAGHCPESLLQNHPLLSYLFPCWILQCPIGPSVPYIIRFDAVVVPPSLLASGKVFPWKHWWGDSGRIPPVLLGILCLSLGTGTRSCPFCKVRRERWNYTFW